MVELARDIESLSNFKRETARFVQRLKQTGQPVVLTINGKAELVVQDAASYQRLLNLAERVESLESLRASLDDADAGRTRPLRKAVKSLGAEMKYAVEITDTAWAEVEEAYDWLADRAPRPRRSGRRACWIALLDWKPCRWFAHSRRKPNISAAKSVSCSTASGSTNTESCSRFAIGPSSSCGCVTGRSGC